MLLDSIDDSSDRLVVAACGDEVIEHVEESLVIDHGLVVLEGSICEEMTSNVVVHVEMSQPHDASVMPEAPSGCVEGCQEGEVVDLLDAMQDHVGMSSLSEGVCVAVAHESLVDVDALPIVVMLVWAP